LPYGYYSYTARAAIVGGQEQMKKTYYIIGVLGLIYLSVLVGRSVYTNWKTDQRVKKLKTELDTLEIGKQDLENQIAYFQTESFKEMEARRKLGLVKPDEKVVILQSEPQSESQSTSNQTNTNENNKPNYRLWWEYFTKDKSFKL